MKTFLRLFTPAVLLAACSDGPETSNQVPPVTDSSATVENVAPTDTVTEIKTNSDTSLFREFPLSEKIMADLNGDGVVEEITFEERNQKMGVVIVDGVTRSESVLGCGVDFEGQDDFSWANTWGIFRGKETFNIIYTEDETLDEEKIKLDHPGIFVKKETGGGMIIYKNGKYTWLSQAC